VLLPSHWKPNYIRKVAQNVRKGDSNFFSVGMGPFYLNWVKVPFFLIIFLKQPEALQGCQIFLGPNIPKWEK
jgi:hypothetical protein